MTLTDSPPMSSRVGSVVTELIMERAVFFLMTNKSREQKLRIRSPEHNPAESCVSQQQLKPEWRHQQQCAIHTCSVSSAGTGLANEPNSKIAIGASGEQQIEVRFKLQPRKPVKIGRGSIAVGSGVAFWQQLSFFPLAPSSTSLCWPLIHSIRVGPLRSGAVTPV